MCFPGQGCLEAHFPGLAQWGMWIWGGRPLLLVSLLISAVVRLTLSLRTSLLCGPGASRARPPLLPKPYSLASPSGPIRLGEEVPFE